MWLMPLTLMGVLRDLVGVDDDERGLMWASMMGSPDSK